MLESLYRKYLGKSCICKIRTQRKAHCLINVYVYVFIYYFSINCYIFLFTIENVSRMLTSDFAILISSRSTKFCYARKHGEFLFSAEGDFISLC